jgi:hypothetical protein
MSVDCMVCWSVGVGIGLISVRACSVLDWSEQKSAQHEFSRPLSTQSRQTNTRTHARAHTTKQTRRTQGGRGRGGMTTGGGRERPAGEKIEEVWTTIAARNMLRSFEPEQCPSSAAMDAQRTVAVVLQCLACTCLPWSARLLACPTPALAASAAPQFEIQRESATKGGKRGERGMGRQASSLAARGQHCSACLARVQASLRS